jgi:hypothetical protein
MDDERIFDDEEGLELASQILDLLPTWNEFVNQKISMAEVIAASPDPDKVRSLLNLLAVHIQKVE